MIRVVVLIAFLAAVSTGVTARSGPSELRPAKAQKQQRLNSAQNMFFENLSHLCGSIFEGYSTFTDTPTHVFAGKKLTASLISCNDREIRIPFSVGDDHSRTWLLRRNSRGLLLKHDRRHSSADPGEIIEYVGWATHEGSASRQFFVADTDRVHVPPEIAGSLWSLSLDVDRGELSYSLKHRQQQRYEVVLQLRKPHKRKKNFW